MKPLLSNPIAGSNARKIRLRTTLVFPFVLQVVVSVGLVGWFSFRSGQEAVNTIASQLRMELVARVEGEVDRYLDTPQQLHQINAQIFQQDLVDLQNLEALEEYFWRQSRLFEDLGTIAFANEQGEFVGANGLQEYVVASTATTGRTLRRFKVDAQGQRGELLQERAGYDARTRTWYKTALAVAQPTWTVIEPSTIGQRLDVSAVYPLYNPDQTLQGVLLCDVPLSGISTFLQNLQIGKTGQAFILERNGLVVANSTEELPFIPGVNDQEPTRLAADQSNSPALRVAVQALTEQLGGLENIERSQQLDFLLEGKRQFLQVLPFQDGRGIDWLIVVVVPESDFMEQININTRNTIILCIATLIASILFGILATRWISRPIVQLTQASEALAEVARQRFTTGEIDPVEIQGVVQIEEVETLAISFNSMAQQLEQSFHALEAQKNSFARFFPPEYLKFLDKEDVVDVELGDHVSKEMAVIFSDIRAFTTLSESMTPQESFNFINMYLQRVAPEIRNHNGVIVKFLGDGVMAVFPDSVADAVQAGIAEFKQVQILNQERIAAGYVPIEIGMGIHVGYMMVGMVGESNRMEGDALSDTVNLTSRLEGLTKFYGVSLLISDDVLRRLDHPEHYQIRFLDQVIVKGRTEPIAIYEVLDAEVESIRDLKLRTIEDFERGQQHYRDRQFAEAQASFERVLQVNPLDKTAKLYLERLHQLAQQEVPSHWTGVWAFVEK